jgi:phosphatidate cytidylyltransferase
MKRVITAAILIPLVLLLLLRGSFLLVVLSTAVIAGLAAWEYLVIAAAHGAQPPRAWTLICLAVLFGATFENPGRLLPALGLAGLLLFILCAFRSPVDRVLPDTAYSVFALLYCGLTMTTVPLLWKQPGGSSLLIFLLCIVWSGDIAALYVGRAYGRHKLAPRLSPNKSWEGSAASLAGSLLIGGLLVTLARTTGGLSLPGPMAVWLVLAAVLNVFAQVGDLVESGIKRGAGIKDSGSLLPGHGGLLDRIDALLLAAPALWYAQWIQQYLQQMGAR